MNTSQDENLLKIPGKKIFQSSFSLKTTVPDPFPGPILTIPPCDPDQLHRPSINGLDLSNAPPLYIPKNMYFPLKKFYKLFELESYQKETNNEKEKWFESDQKKEKNSGLMKEMEWTEEDELILIHSGKKTLERELNIRQRKMMKRRQESGEIKKRSIIQEKLALEVRRRKMIMKDSQN